MEQTWKMKLTLKSLSKSMADPTGHSFPRRFLLTLTCHTKRLTAAYLHRAEAALLLLLLFDRGMAGSVVYTSIQFDLRFRWLILIIFGGRTLAPRDTNARVADEEQEKSSVLWEQMCVCIPFINHV